MAKTITSLEKHKKKNLYDLGIFLKNKSMNFNTVILYIYMTNWRL